MNDYEIYRTVDSILIELEQLKQAIRELEEKHMKECKEQ